MTPEYLSYSSISAYLACGEAWRYRYVEKIKTPTSPELVFGSAVHATIEAYVARRDFDLLTHWSAIWPNTIENVNVAWDEDTPEQHYNNGVRLLSSKEVSAGLSKIKPMVDDHGPRIERKIVLNVPGVPVPIIGYIDIVTADGIPGDFKTSAVSWNPAKAQGETQSLFYLAALNQAGDNAHGWHFRHYVLVKTKEPKFQVLEHVHKPGEIMWLFEMIRRVWSAIEAEHYPLNPTGWKCNPVFCDFWGRCRGKYV